MMKSIFATLCMLSALFAATLVYAEDMSDDASASSMDEPLPPMIDPAVANDTSSDN